LASKTKTLILGVGNILLRDEGIGPRTIEELKKETLPSSVELCDAGTQILDTVLGFEEIEKLIVIDAVKTEGEPGSIYKFRPENIKEGHNVKLSLHQATLIEALGILEFQKRLPQDVVIFGVVPRTIDWGLEPSGEVMAKMPDLIKLIKEEIKC
jgi:hydrogenase maturation protease